MNAENGSSKPLGQSQPLPTDSQLIEACLAGDAEAWARLLRRYGSLIYSIAYRHGLGRDDAGDVFQLVSIALLDHLTDLRDATKLPGWIATIARRYAADVAARNRRQAARDMRVQPENVQQTWDEATPEELLSSLRDQMLVREAMERLPDRCRQLLTLLFSEEEDVSYAEIARRLDMPIGSIGPMRSRCLEQLRRILEEAGF